MSRYRDGGLDVKVYVGDLPREASEKELERHFGYYGRLRSVWVARNPPGFAFIEFEDHRDADDAVRALDGGTICGARVRVEHSNGKVRPKPWQRGGGGGRMDRGPPRSRKAFHPDDKCYECGERGHYAYDCYRLSRRRKRSRSRSKSASRSRSRSRSRRRSRSRSDRRRSLSRSPSRSPRMSRSRSRDDRKDDHAD
ncbi:serine/arginine-rich splicing factor 7-like [Gigantopelta aegis]|uniref:serine/arginine-rich splicing factor 7-like n=1 Tax=Gigantopelta aegis TaxID=1735272 RepID=UPI001B88B2F1|nr:serine/arginine-rich splicing factor 7-like [Gigantopelta aegis]XP_041365208.1 serine/arginine-rich splicing factor 7-like [Gigantopelta aegis]